MQGIAAISFALVLGVSLVVGIRLMAIWSRTRGMPELLLGGMLLLTAGIGYPSQIMASQIESAAAMPLYLLGYVAASAGVALLYVFTWRVFRAQEKWALVFACAGVAALGFNASMRVQEVLVSHDVRHGRRDLGKFLFQGFTVTVAFLWTAWESLRHYAMMKRRARLGLADPTLANRFLLWGSMALFSSAGTVVNVAAVAMRIDVMNDPGMLLASSLSALGAGGAAVARADAAALVPRVRALALGGRAPYRRVRDDGRFAGFHLGEQRGRGGNHAQRNGGARHGAPRAQGSRARGERRRREPDARGPRAAAPEAARQPRHLRRQRDLQRASSAPAARRRPSRESAARVFERLAGR